MFGSLGVPELMLIFAVALILFGPRKLPQIGKTFGRALGEFRRASNDFKRTIEEEVAVDEIRGVERDLRASIKDLDPTTPPEPRSPSSADDGGEGG